MPDDADEGHGQAVPAEQRVTAEILEKLDALPDESRRQMMAVLYQHRGPLPDPATFAAYGSIYPDAPREILEMARRQHDHQIDMASRALTSEIDYRRETLRNATVIVALFVICATALGIAGHETAASIIGGTGGIVVVAGAILRGRDLFPKTESPEPAKTPSVPSTAEAPAPRQGQRPNRPGGRPRR